ncbi:MAG: SPOR domain-containing protein [Gammaproteobacteria bacterium]|nr:SPOR domain-containing protein [Gammaproteobacteria bacterium]
MFAKLGFLLLVAAFGALAFVAGTLAPPSIRQPLTTAIDQWAPLLSSHTSAAKSPTAANSAPAESADGAPLPYEALLLPATPAADVKYALQLGLFTEPASANSLTQRLRELRYPFKTIPVIDQNGAHWSALAAGTFDSVAAAQSARGFLSQQLQLSQSLTVIQLPAETKAKISQTAP